MRNQKLAFIGVIIVYCFVSSVILSSLAMASDSNFQKKKLKLGVSVNTDFNFYKGCVKFSEVVKERTGGSVIVEVFPNGALGSDRDMAESVRNRIIDMWAGGMATLSMIKGWESFVVVQLPYIFKQETSEAQNEFLNKLFEMPRMKNIAEKAAETSNIRALSLNFFYGMRHVTTKDRQIKTPEDLKGLKIRTMNSPIGRAPMEILGASVTPMAFPEVYTALQMGVIDGQENPPATILANKFYEVQKYLSLTGHMSQSVVLCMNEALYQSVSPELQKIFDEAAKEAAKYQTELQIRDNKRALDELKQKGMIINTIDRSLFVEKSKDAWKEFQPDVTQELYDFIINSQE